MLGRPVLSAMYANLDSGEMLVGRGEIGRAGPCARLDGM